MIHHGDVVVFAVQAVKVDSDTANLVLRFAQILIVGRLYQADMLAVGILKVHDGHGMHIVDMAVEVGYSLAVADALADDNQSDRN